MSLNILVVDDSDVIRSMVIKTMRLAHIPLGSVHEASNGEEALALLESQWIDVVLADINMPVMDGRQMIERIRASGRLSDLPIVVISTEGAVMSIDRLGEMGVDAYIRKPFTPEQLRDVIEHVAGRMIGGEQREVLEHVLEQVLSLFAMMFGEAETDSGTGVPDGRLMRADMTFHGGASGHLTIAAPFELCNEMAANAMGIEPCDSRAGERAGDAIGEFVNMTCGQIATTLQYEMETRLSPPEVTGMDAEDWRSLSAAPGTVRFLVEDRPMLASLAVRSQ